MLTSAVSPEALQSTAAAGDWLRYLLPMDRAVDHFAAFHLDEAASMRLLNGQAVLIDPHAVTSIVAEPATCRVYDSGGTFIAIGEYDGATGALKPVKVFHTNETT
jgi:tRNA U55 pseudouridine synthase TruB